MLTVQCANFQHKTFKVSGFLQSATDHITDIIVSRINKRVFVLFFIKKVRIFDVRVYFANGSSKI